MKPIEKITWEIGTAYDFLVSLILLHDPKRYGFLKEIGMSWKC
jgi:hypothetical protein